MKNFKWLNKKVTDGSCFPSSREGHTLTYIDDDEDGSILLFGGISYGRMNEVFLYSISIFNFHQSYV